MDARSSGNGFSSALAAMIAGAALMYLFDPRTGRRRRHVARDKLVHRWRAAGHALRVVSKDLSNRAHGIVPTARHYIDRYVSRRYASDEVLSERVRSRIGRVVSHPSAIEVLVDRGTVTLKGQILASELHRLLHTAAFVPGVKSVANELEAHAEPGHIPGLQGGLHREPRTEFLQEHWTPGIRVLAGIGGLALPLYGARRRAPGAAFAAVPGALFLARAATNTDIKRLLGWRGAKGVTFSKRLHIDALPEQVYRFWSEFENFPKFMRHVRAVYKNPDNTWHWRVAGSLGRSVEWNSRVTENDPPRALGWTTTHESPVRHSGALRFEPDGDGTRVEVHMTYLPAAGVTGHLVASLFGADPHAELDEDLLRAKTYLETGKPARDAAHPSSAASASVPLSS